MGQSTDGILCYGIDFDEDFKFPWDDNDDDERGSEAFEKWLAKEMGVTEPDCEFDTEENKNRHRKYWDEKRAVVKTSPVELVEHCHYECRMYILAVRGTVTTASRGYPQTITNFTVTPEQHNSLVEFLNKYGIECDHSEIGWKLCSDWS